MTTTPNSAGLSLRQLEYLVTTVGEGRLNRAARQLHVTEPTLSQQLRALERAVGTPLLVRGADGVRPTAAGEAFLPHARCALHSAERARAEARAVQQGRGRTVRLAVLPSLLPGLLTALGSWAQARPGVDLLVETQPTGERLREQLTARAVDLALAPRPPGWSGAVWPVHTEELVLLCPADDPLRGRRVPPTDLLDRRWICYGEEPWQPLRSTGRTERFGGDRAASVLRVPCARAAVDLAASGAGLTAVPAHILPPELRSRVIHTDPVTRREITVFAGPQAPPEILADGALLAADAATRLPPDDPHSGPAT
ncbi:LysR family transcriptional regulator [Kitasatospora sp. NBC_01302]|uniref:LysR family transcriptional regulator n=1 Tax=Kitasatospora sp. NBC_01302 TaxID=2903575 RepID=UPI002E13F22F|nr:LysR family transcriptional regulator [Kitasatospora sp. NBC_01302]